jgi:SAM-dependent methyltransferase
MHREAATTAEYTLADQERMKRATRYFAWQARMATEQIGQRIIEIGCGLGNFTEHLLDREFVAGVDVVEGCLEHLRARFPNARNLETRCLDVQDDEFRELKRYRPDTIVCLNVLEHVRDDRRALANMREVLVPGGRAILILPAFESLYGPIDRNLGHFRRYSKAGWRALAGVSGFRVTTARYFNSVGFLGWWVNAKLLRKTEQSEGQIALFDSVIVPVLSRLESWMEPPFGQSIFTVLESAQRGARSPGSENNRDPLRCARCSMEKPAG